jgi:hypothetical protein
VYFIRETGDDGHIKIGTTAGSPHVRLRALQTANPRPLELLGAIPGDASVERKLHERFSHLRLAGEWFRSSQELTSFIDGATFVSSGPDDDGKVFAPFEFGCLDDFLSFMKAWKTNDEIIATADAHACLDASYIQPYDADRIRDMLATRGELRGVFPFDEPAASFLEELLSRYDSVGADSRLADSVNCAEFDSDSAIHH